MEFNVLPVYKTAYMKAQSNTSIQSEVATRLLEIIHKSKLSPAAIAAFLDCQPKQFEKILMAKATLSNHIAETFAKAFDLNLYHIFDSHQPLPVHLRRSDALRAFLRENKNLSAYFQTKQSLREDAHFVQHTLLNSGLFKKPVYIWEVIEYSRSLGQTFTSARLAQLLNSLVDYGLLASEKRPIRRRDGSYGQRLVHIYFMPSRRTKDRI